MQFSDNFYYFFKINTVKQDKLKLLHKNKKEKRKNTNKYCSVQVNFIRYTGYGKGTYYINLINQGGWQSSTRVEIYKL